MMTKATEEILLRHPHMIQRVAPRLWGLACKVDRLHGKRRKQQKSERRLVRGVKAFVAKYDPARTDARAAECERIFDELMRRSFESGEVPDESRTER